MDGSGIQAMFEYKCLVLPDPVDEVTQGGIILAPLSKEKAEYETVKATFVMAGSLAFTDPDWRVKPVLGDRIYINKHCGFPHVGADGQKYRIVNDKDIIARLEE